MKKNGGAILHMVLCAYPGSMQYAMPENDAEIIVNAAFFSIDLYDVS